MSDDTPAFFVPNAHDDKDEGAYALLAERCQRRPLPADKRIYSIVFDHDGEEWTATVGRPLSGVRTQTRAGRETRTHLSDQAVVLAIFEGSPFAVITNARPFGETRSAWENPFWVGAPRQVINFGREPS